MFKTDKMDDNNKLKKKVKPIKKAVFTGIVLKPVKIGDKYNFKDKRGQKVKIKTEKEYNNYIKNKIIK